jgi:hypothetical protein
MANKKVNDTELSIVQANLKTASKQENNKIDIGDIVLYTKLNLLDEVINIFKSKKNISYNKILTLTKVIDKDIANILTSTLNLLVLTPNKKYSEVERTKFITLNTKQKYDITDFNELVTIINSVRPKTFTKEVVSIQDFIDNKYYKEKKIK